MTARAASLVAALAVLPDDRARLAAGLPELDALYRDCVRAAAPPNPQFERERIIAQAGNPRELVFLFGLLSEGENEAGLLLELIESVWIADPMAPVAHIADEAWYYLRTSIDSAWQLDDGPPSLAAALGYLYLILDERRESLLSAGVAPPPVALEAASERTALLRSLRERLAAADG